MEKKTIDSGRWGEYIFIYQYLIRIDLEKAMKRCLIPIALFYVAVFPAAAQMTPTPRFVVIDDAQEEIAELENRNAEMAAANLGLEEDIRGLEEQISLSEGFNLQADDMIDRLSASAGEIYTLMQSIVDPETRRELQNRMEENRRSRYDLENRKRRENESVARAQERIENNRRMMAINRVRSKANDQRIEYLQACIDLSVSENRDVGSVLDNADRVRQEVERLLGQ
jgi:hypothetical protein